MALIKYIFALVATVVLLGSVLSAGVAFSAVETENDIETEIVLIRDVDEEDKNLFESTSGIEVIEEYPYFVLIETSKEDRVELEKRGNVVESLENRDYVGLQSYSFYADEGTPEIPDHLEIEAHPNEEVGYYIVQFIGPIRREWKERLEEEGAVLHEFRHRFNFIVEMDLETKRRVEEKYFVNWVGIYQPAYRVDRNLLEEDGEQLIEVSFFGGVDLRESAMEVEYLGGEIHAVGRNGITVDIHTRRIETIANLRGVKSITEGMEEPELYNDDATWITQTNVQDYRKVTEQGITGTDQLITVCDSELYSDHEAFEDGVDYGDDHRKIQEHYSIGGDLYQGVYHGTHCAGTVLGESLPYGQYSNHDGNALEARLIFQDIGTAAGGLSVPSDMYAEAWQPSYDSGSRAHTNSWGGGIQSYTGLAIDGDEFIWDNKDYNILFAMGNSGPFEETMSGEPEGKNFFSVGGVTNYPNHNTMYSSSSRGYADDGRIKPTVLHVAQGVTSADQDYDDYATLTGTSMSTPGIAGQVGQVREYYEEGWHVDGTPNPEEGFNPSSALVRATMINGAVEITGDGAYHNEERFPNNDQGYGRSMLDRALHFEGDDRELIVYDSWDEGVELDTGESWEMSFGVDDPTQDIEVTLAWSDYPGSAGSDESNPAIVNDLDLELNTPGGTRYVGNAFTGHDPGYSEANPTDNPWSGLREEEYDGLNVEENILLLPGENGVEPGTYELTVSAHQVAEGSQPFAVVVSGSVAEGPTIELERPEGGEYWEIGTEEEIIWSTEEGGGQITHVDLDYSVDGGTTWSEIEHDITDDGSYVWQVPNEPTEEAMVRATVYDEGDTEPGVDTSGEFTITDITPPEVTLTSPTGGEEWHAGEFEDITWESEEGDEDIDFVDIQYTTDGGDSWDYIAQDEDDTGLYTWEIPDETSSESRVRVSVHCEGDTSNFDTSDNFDLVGYPPEPPMNLDVQHLSEPVQEVFDDFGDGNYDGWTVYDGVWDASGEYLQGHGSISTPTEWDGEEIDAYGRWEWDFEFTDVSDDDGNQIMRNHFVQIDHEDPNDSSGYYIIITGYIGAEGQINLWRWDEGDTPDNPIISGMWNPNTDINTLSIERDEDGEFVMYLNGDLLGEGSDDTYTTNEYIAFRHNENPAGGEDHIIHEIRREIPGDGDEHNQVSWDASPGDWLDSDTDGHERDVSISDPDATFEAADSGSTSRPRDGSISPEQEEEWRWLYEDDWRAETDDGVGLTGPGVWYGAIRLDLSDDVGNYFTDVAYYDQEEANNAQAYVGEDDGGAPSEDWIPTEEYDPDGAGWVELELENPMLVEEPGDYWIVIAIDDIGEGYFPFGCIEPHVDDGGLVNMDDPHNPGSWDELPDLNPDLDFTWALEARVVSLDVYFDVEIVSYDEEVDSGEEVVVDYTVTNQGDEEDTQDIEFYVDGDLMDTVHDVTLGSGGVYDDVFTWQTDEDDIGPFLLTVASEDTEEEVTVMVGDTKEVSHYNIYRSESMDGPWDETTFVDEVPADGSSSYSYIDEDKGEADDIFWWYVVRSVSEEGVEEQNTDAVQEPGAEGPVPPIEPEPEDGATDVTTEVELSVYVEHDEGESMDVSFHDASDNSLIGTHEDVDSGNRAYVTWSGLGYDTTYEWYSITDDGEVAVQSPTWSFTTQDEEELGAFDLMGYFHESHDGEARFYDGEDHYGNISAIEFENPDNVAINEGTETSSWVDPHGGFMWNAEEGENRWSESPPILGHNIYFISEVPEEDVEGEAGYVWSTVREVDGDIVASPQHSMMGQYEMIPTPMESSVGEDRVEIEVESPVYTDWDNDAELSPGKGTFDEFVSYSVFINGGEYDDWTYLGDTEEVPGDYDDPIEPWNEDTDPGTVTTGMNSFEITDLEQEEYEVKVRMNLGEGLSGGYHGGYDEAYTTYSSGAPLVIEIEPEEEEYELTIDVEGEGTTDPEPGTHVYPEGEEVTVEAIADEGHGFVEWTGDYEGTEDEILLIMDENKEITAHFEELEYHELTINIEGEGTVEVVPDEEEYEEGEEVILTAVPADGWYFDEWTGDAEGMDDEILLIMDENKEITAHFEELEYHELTINIEGEGTVEVVPDEEEYEEGEEVVLTAVPADGWYFDRWTGDAEGTQREITIIMDDDKEITANFEEVGEDEHLLTINVDGEGTTEPEPGDHLYEEGDEVELTAVPVDGWIFVEWTGDVESEEDEITIIMDDDKEITAHFEEVEYYELTVNVEGEGTVEIEPEQEDYEAGTEVILTSVPEEGWYFDGWTGDYEERSREITVLMDADKTLTATFNEVGEDEYVLTIDRLGDGTTEPEPGDHIYTEGEEVTVNALPAEGWYFVEWTGDHTGTEEQFSIIMDSDKSITAVFEEEVEYYELTVNIEGDGEVVVEPEQEDYAEGTEVTLTAVADEGWYFVEWTGDYESEEDEIDLIMDQHYEITAVFEEEVVVDTYTLTVDIEGEGTVDIDPEQDEYEEGTVVELTASPEEGWEFAEWTGDETGTDTTIEVTMDSDITITAHFEELEEAFFEVNIVSPEDGDEFEEGDEIVVEYEVTNTGGVEGEQDIEFYANGEHIETESGISLEPGAFFTGEFTWEANDAGDIELEVRSSEAGEILHTMSVTVSVSEETEDDSLCNWWLILIILIIAGVILVILLLVFKRKKEEEEPGEEYSEFSDEELYGDGMVSEENTLYQPRQDYEERYEEEPEGEYEKPEGEYEEEVSEESTEQKETGDEKSEGEDYIFKDE